MKKHVFGNTDSSDILIQLVDKHELGSLENEVSLIRAHSGRNFCLTAFEIENWNQDLSPWAAPPVFGKEGFGSGASDTLAEVLKECREEEKTYYIGGYSLAGLFALWAAYQTNVFHGVAAASPSVWFPGFIEYAKESRIQVESVYLSLGDKEPKTRNPVMATVGERVQDYYDLLKDSGVDSLFEWNQGNHFKEFEIRTAKAFSWLLR